MHFKCHTGFLKGGQFAWVIPVPNEQQELVHVLKHVKVNDVRDLASAQRQHQVMSEVNISTYPERRLPGLFFFLCINILIGVFRAEIFKLGYFVQK